MPADPARAQSVFLAAVELPDPAARSAFADEACRGDSALRGRVEALLRAHDQPDSLLDAPLAPDTRTASLDPDAAATRSVGDEDNPDLGDALGYLAPAARAGSLGRIGHYEVLEVLGRGGFGVVFRAFDDVLQRVVAVKLLAPSLAATSPARKRFLREARSSAQVRHENVVQVHAVEEQPLPYLVMEFVPGETLQQRLDRAGPLDVAEVLRIGRQIAEGLAAAHAQGLIHRDIKPANVLLDGGPQGRVKITDFGLARAADDASLTRSGVVAGTPMYMAPEQAKGEALDHRADLFSLGSVLYVMCSGRPPFRASSTMAVLKRVCDENPRPIREVIPEVPAWLCRIVEKLHAKDPAGRFQTARDVADVLADCEAQVQAHGALKDFARIPGGKPTPHPARRKWIALATALWALTGLFWAASIFGPDVIRYAGNHGDLEFAPADGLVYVGVREANSDPGTAISYGLPRRDAIERPPGTYVLDPAFAPGRELDHWEITSDGLFASRRTLKRGGRAPEIEIARGERVTVRAVMRDEPATPPGPPPSADAASLQGNWTAVSAQVQGQELPAEAAKHFGLAFAGNRVRITAGTPGIGGGTQEGTFTLAPDREPKEIDIALTKDTAPTRGIYRLDGDRLTVCMGEAGATRPVVFDTTPRMLVVLRRESAAGWVPLFNGKDLTGWHTLAGKPGSWRVENGVLIGTNPAITHLFTDRGDLANFHLRAEAMIGKTDIGGLFFRAGNQFVRGNGTNIPPGYEVPIRGTDGDETYRSGSIVNVKGTTEQNAIKPNEWFTLEVVAVGRRLTVKINGTTTADIGDSLDTYTKGHVVLQVCLGGTLQFRKIEIKELPANPPPELGWVQLFNGTDLSGWKPVGHNGWAVKDGVLVGRTDPERPGFLMTEREFTDYELELEVKLLKGADSGVFVRAWADADPVGNELPEVQIIDTETFPNLAADRGHAALLNRAAPKTKVEPAIGEWQRVRVHVTGGRIRVWFGQSLAIDHTIPDLRPKAGIGLQHQLGQVEFRNVRVRDLAKPAGGPSSTP